MLTIVVNKPLTGQYAQAVLSVFVGCCPCFLEPSWLLSLQPAPYADCLTTMHFYALVSCGHACSGVSPTQCVAHVEAAKASWLEWAQQPSGHGYLRIGWVGPTTSFCAGTCRFHRHVCALAQPACAAAPVAVALLACKSCRRAQVGP